MNPLARALGQPILSDEPLAGGCVANARRVRTRQGEYFCKVADRPTPLFLEEAAGLNALAATGTIRCPRVLHSDDRVLVLEWIDSETSTPQFWRAFGRALAALHQVGQSEFGFAGDNHIGLTPQLNPVRSAREISWCDYFMEYRLRPMLEQPRIAADPLAQALYRKAEGRVRAALERVNESPSLVHGDLWSGNFLCARGGEPVLIDPAVYRGHREVDLAMTFLFGGFDVEFHRAYHEAFPLTEGFEARKTIYNLYHMLNHWILFGPSYRDQVYAMLRSL